MNICFFDTYYPNLNSGGIENVTYKLINAFSARGHKVCLCSFHNGGPIDNCAQLIINKDASDYCNVIDFIRENKVEFVINQSPELKWKEIVQAIKRDQESVRVVKALHTTPSHAIKAVIDNEPLYLCSNIFSRFQYRCSIANIIRRYRRKNYLRSTYAEWIDLYDSVVLLSKHYIEEFEGLALKDASGKVSAIGNPIDFSKIQIEQNKEKIVLFVGRMSRQAKRPDRLLAVWKRIWYKYPDWKLVLVGDGPLKEDFIQACQRNQLKNIEFVGFADSQPYYKQASILASTSTYEGFSMVIAEALSFGVIPIAFNSFGALGDLIMDRVTGMKVHPYSISDYARKLTYLMSNEEEVTKMRSNILSDTEFKNRYDLSNVASQWEALLESLQSKY